MGGTCASPVRLSWTPLTCVRSAWRSCPLGHIGVKSRTGRGSRGRWQTTTIVSLGQHLLALHNILVWEEQEVHSQSIGFTLTKSRHAAHVYTLASIRAANSFIEQAPKWIYYKWCHCWIGFWSSKIWTPFYKSFLRVTYNQSKIIIILTNFASPASAWHHSTLPNTGSATLTHYTTTKTLRQNLQD
jgi:hypothetical protein